MRKDINEILDNKILSLSLCNYEEVLLEKYIFSCYESSTSQPHEILTSKNVVDLTFISGLDLKEFINTPRIYFSFQTLEDLYSYFNYIFK